MPWTLRTLLTISAILLPLMLYVTVRFAGSAGLLAPEMAVRVRWGMVILILWLYVLPVGSLLLYLSGSRANPLTAGTTVNWADMLFHYPLWVAVIIVLELLAPYLLLDIGALLARLVPRWFEAVRIPFAWIRVGLALLVTIYVIVRVVLDTSHVRDSVDTVAVAGLPPALDGVTISLVGDIQVDRYTGDQKVKQVREIITSHHPELLLSSGDLVTSGTAYLGEAAKAICGLSGSAATVAVMGDHDIWSAPAEIRALHLRCGWAFLDNEHTIITCRGQKVLISGLTHIYSDRLAPDVLERFLREAPEADLKILLVHQPAQAVVRLAAEHGYALLLAGHTHGGQIVFHPLGIPLTPSMRETRYYAGLYTVGEMTVVVTRGVGLTLAPVRYHSPAEVSTLILKRKE